MLRRLHRLGGQPLGIDAAHLVRSVSTGCKTETPSSTAFSTSMSWRGP
jgi:hypothetical protein